MDGITPLGWLAIVSLVSLIASLFVAQAGERNRALFNLANMMTLGGFAGLVISGLIYYFS